MSSQISVCSESLNCAVYQPTLSALKCDAAEGRVRKFRKGMTCASSMVSV
jgi:hypothetical protein